MSLRDKVKTYDKKYGTGNFWKPEEGQNQIRLLTEPELFDDVYEGEPAGSFIAYILVRDSGEDSFALFTLPKSLVRWLADQEELGKFSGYPMPFDVLLFKQTTGKKTTYVSVAVEGTSAPITAQQQAVISAAKPIGEVAQALAKKKQANLPPGSRASAMPQLTESPAEALARQNRNKAELNPMFTAFEAHIKKAEDEAALEKVIGQIEGFVESKTLSEFEADLLRTIVQNKKASLTGVEVEDIKVEDIPF